MTITHHPPEDLLARFASGCLDEAQRLVVAVHVSSCERCDRIVRAFEHISGVALEETTPLTMSSNAFQATMTKIDRDPTERTHPPAKPRATSIDESLPVQLRGYELGKRRRVAPGIFLQPINLPEVEQSRAFLLESAAGTRMIDHTHSGTELTLVLKGSFSHEGGHFGPGDFDYGDADVDHRPIVGDEGPCLCLVAMTGDLRMHGLLGRILSPFIRL